MDIEDPSTPYLSDEVKWGIVISRKYYNEKYTDIMSRYGLQSKGTVSKILKKYEETGTVENQFSGPGSYTKQSEELLSAIDVMIAENPKTTQTIIQRELNKQEVYVSTSLISRIRSRLGYKKGKIKLRPSLTEAHKQKRVEYCSKMQFDQMKNVIFSDECIFSLNKDGSMVWYRVGEERMVKELINPDVKMMVWGAISRKGKFSLYWHGSTVNQETYKECLSEFIPEANRLYGHKKWRFQQDWAPAHKPKLIRAFILEDAKAILDHPSVSPDLNPIEKVWSWMKRKIEKWGPTTKDELEVCIESAWDLLDNEKINRFIDHMHTIMPQIIQRDGNIID